MEDKRPGNRDLLDTTAPECCERRINSPPFPSSIHLLLSSLTPSSHHRHRYGLGVRVLTLEEGASLTGWRWVPVCCESCDKVTHGAAGMPSRWGTAQAARVILHPEKMLLTLSDYTPWRSANPSPFSEKDMRSKDQWLSQAAPHSLSPDQGQTQGSHCRCMSHHTHTATTCHSGLKTQKPPALSPPLRTSCKDHPCETLSSVCPPSPLCQPPSDIPSVFSAAGMYSSLLWDMLAR